MTIHHNASLGLRSNHQTLVLVSFVATAFIPRFSFTSCRFLSPPGAALLFPHTHMHRSPEELTPRHRHPNEIKQSFHPGSVSHFLARPVRGHTAAVPLMDFWHRMAERRTQNPSQGADACFLLTYAPEMEQLEGRAGDIGGGGCCCRSKAK